MISRKFVYAIVIVLVVACIVRFGRQRIDERLQPVKGKWTHKASNNQTWTYKLKSSDDVYFSIDHQSTRLSITGIEASGGSVRIRVNDPGVETITIRKSSKDAVVISSGLHPAMTFTR